MKENGAVEAVARRDGIEEATGVTLKPCVTCGSEFFVIKDHGRTESGGWTCGCLKGCYMSGRLPTVQEAIADCNKEGLKRVQDDAGY